MAVCLSWGRAVLVLRWGLAGGGVGWCAGRGENGLVMLELRLFSEGVKAVGANLVSDDLSSGNRAAGELTCLYTLRAFSDAGDADVLKRGRSVAGPVSMVQG